MTLSTRTYFNICLVISIAVLNTVFVKSEVERIIFYNGHIFTSRELVESVVVTGNRITDIGSTEEMLSKYGNDIDHVQTTKINLFQHSMMAGINDAHVHIQSPPANGIYLNDESFVPAPGPSVHEVVDALRNASRLYSEQQDQIFYMFVGDAFRDEFMHIDAAKPYLNPREALSGAAPNHAVIVYEWSRHCAFINDQLMRVIGIGIEYPEHSLCTGRLTGIFGHDMICNESQQLVGIAEEYSMWSVQRLISRKFITTAQIVRNYKAYMSKANAMGITSVQNMPLSITNEQSNEALATLQEDDELSVRWRSIHFSTNVDDIGEFEALTRSMSGMDASKMWNYFGVKYIMDGTPIEQNALMKRAYRQKRNGADWFGKLNVKHLRQIFATELAEHSNANDISNQLLIHIVGDQSTEMLMEALTESASPQDWRNKRLRLEHGDMIYEHLDTVREYEAIIVQNPTHTSLPRIIESRWGKMENAMPFQSVLNHSIHFAFGSDNQLINPWLDIFFAVTHPQSNGLEKVSMMDALLAYTVGSAYAEFMERDKGRVQSGYLADLIVLNTNVFDADFDPQMLFATRSVLTMVDGQIKYQDDDYWSKLQSKIEL